MRHHEPDSLWEELDDWLEPHGWFFVDHGIYTPEEWSDPIPYWGVELEQDSNTGKLTVCFGQFIGLAMQTEPSPIGFTSIGEFSRIMENLWLAIHFIKSVETGRAQLRVIEGGKS